MKNNSNKDHLINLIEQFSTNIDFNENFEILTNNEFEIPKTKHEGIQLWIKYSNVSYSESKIEELYIEYKKFLTSKFGENLSSSVIYLKPNKYFKNALEKILFFKF